MAVMALSEKVSSRCCLWDAWCVNSDNGNVNNNNKDSHNYVRPVRSSQ